MPECIASDIKDFFPAAAFFPEINPGKVWGFLQAGQPFLSLCGESAVSVCLFQQQFILEHFMRIDFSPVIRHIPFCLPILLFQPSDGLLRFLQRFLQNGTDAFQMADFIREGDVIGFHRRPPLCAGQTVVWDNRIPPAAPLPQIPVP